MRLDYESEIRQSVLSGSYKRPGATSMIQYARDVYLPWAQENKRSWINDRLHIKALEGFFGDKTFDQITRMLVRKFIKERRETDTVHETPRSVATVNRELACLRAIFSHAIEDGLASSNPCLKHKKDKGPSIPENNERTRYLTLDEQQRLLNQCVGARAHLRPIIILAIQTGMRRGEILSLRWPQVDLSRSLVYLPVTKSGRPQTVFLNDVARGILAELWAKACNRHGCVFVGGRKRKPDAPESLSTVKKAFAGACKDAGIANLHFHDLRHTCGVRLVETGAHPRIIQSVLRHSSLKMTERYTNPLEASKRAALERLSEFGMECQENAKKGVAR